MMEMLMLLGAGLAAAGVVGMSGILPQYGQAESAAAGAEPGDTGMAEGESKDLLGRIREMGILPDFGRGKAKPILGEGGDEAPAGLAPADADHGYDVTNFMEEADPLDVDEDLAFDEDMQDARVEELSLNTPEVDAEAPQAEALHVEETRVEAPQAPSENEVDALLARLGNIAEPAPSAEAPEPHEVNPMPEAGTFEDDDIPVISDFIAGEESLMLMLPEDMDADTIVRIEPVGDTGSDAAIVLEDTRGSVTAAVISGGFGAVTPADIELERAA